MFNSKKEFAQAMMDGGVYEYDGNEYYYDESFTIPFRLSGFSGGSKSVFLTVGWNDYMFVTEVKPLQGDDNEK